MSRTKNDKWLLVAVVVLALVCFFGQLLFYFKGSVPYFARISGGGELFDVVAPTSSAELYARLTDFGSAGRSEYVFRNKTTDVLLPLVLLAALVQGMERLLRAYSLGRWRGAIASLPYIYVASDLAENLTVLSLIHHYPHKQATLAAILPTLTWVKTLSFSGALLILLCGGTFALVSRLRRRSAL